MKSNFLKLLSIQIALTAAAYFLWAKDATHQSAAYVWAGSLVSGLQFGLLYFVWWRVFAKKKIAPSVIAVVIKYALLGLAFWYLYPLNNGEMNALVIGILINPVAITLFALTKKSNKNLN